MEKNKVKINENETIHGFELNKKTYVPEIVSTVYEFTHKKTQARLIFMENDDDNKVFSVAFRTPPVNDTGVAHILEHSVLCGSRKYPLKEPFVELLKGSLNTFLNAMTYPDKTVYPVASRNDKDFQNLMDVYLDAVFYPAIYNVPEILLQEGWHYETENAEAPLTYSGVVYNEMKGALSSPRDLLGSETLKALYPDTVYKNESGGDPEYIPELTQDEFLDFHRRYYHPTNSYIYLYGDMDIKEKLRYLDEEYLSHFEKIEINSRILPQKPFDKMSKREATYAVGENEPLEGKTFLSMNAALPADCGMKTLTAMNVLWSAILHTEGAPLREALIDAGIGRDIIGESERDLIQPSYGITAVNAKNEDVDEFCRIIDDKLKELVKDGIDRELLQSSLNALEFRLREADFGTQPKGLIYNLAMLRTWLYDGDPKACLYYEDMIAELNKGIGEGYFEKLLDEMFLNNPHKTLVVLAPDREKAKKREEKLSSILAEKKAKLSKDEVESIIKTTAALKERQQAPETPEALLSIPLLKISDIKKDPDKLPLEVRDENCGKILFSDLETGGIAYLMMFFDASKIPEEKIPYAYLLIDLLAAMSTENHTYSELSKLINLHTGGIKFDLTPLMPNFSPDAIEPKLIMQAKVLVKKLPKLVSILQDVLTKTRFDDKKRLGDLISQERSSSEQFVLGQSYAVMSQRLSSYLCKSGAYSEIGALSFYDFIRELDDNFDKRYDETVRILNELMPLVFNTDKLVTSVTMSEKNYSEFTEAYEDLISSLRHDAPAAAEFTKEPAPENEALSAMTQVCYVGKGANYKKLGYEYRGSMHVLETILRYDYLWTKIRVQGGAYGAFLAFQRVGNMIIGSYRDPNLSETLAVYDAIPAFLREFDCSERELTKYIIGAINAVDVPLTPQLKGSIAAKNYLCGLTYEERAKSRHEILKTTIEDIRGYADMMEKCLAEDIICVFANEEKLKENDRLFKKIIKINE